MAFDKTNTFSLNKNDKGDNPARPDYRGEVDINGVRYWISGWIRDGANGKFISGPVELAKDEHQYNAQPVGADEDVPF